MLEFSRQADYAVRIVIELSHVPQGTLMHSSVIAARRDIPVKYLPTVVRNLVRAGIIETFRGSKGGVALAEPPQSITLRDVIEAVDGPLLLNRCQLRPGDCRDNDEESCALHDFWEHMAWDILGVLDNKNFSDLMASELEKDL